MGKGGGKSKGKIAFTIIGAAIGAWGYSFNMFGSMATSVFSSAMFGASIASTLWSVTNKQNPYGNLDSDYSQDDYSRFNTVTNDVNQNACIPVIYGTRKYGGLQVWHNPYNGNRYLQKDVIVCESGIEGVYNVCANEELIKDDTNISIYNIQHPDSTVQRVNKSTLRLKAGGKTQDYTLGNTDDYNAQTSLLNTVIDKIKSEAGNGWKIDGAVDDRTSKGISANTLEFNSSNPVKCYVDPEDLERKGAVVIDTRGYSIGTYEFKNGETPDNYNDVGGYPKCAWIRSDLVASSRLSGSNPTINAFVKGMKVEVWKGGKWSIEYSENPAWIIRDFLLSKHYGTGNWITKDILDEDSFREVADYCDEIIEYTDFDGTIKKTPRYKLNIVLDSQKPPIEHLSSMLAVFGGFITIGKQIALKVEKAETPVYAFDDDTIVKDSMSIGQTSLDDTPNRYKIGYFDPNQEWTEVKVVVEDLELQYERNNRITEKVVTLAGCTSQNQALRIGRLYRDLNKVCSLTLSFSVATQGMMLECGDVITVTYGGIFENMPVRITQIEETNSGVYQLTCRQYNETIYNDSLGANIVNPNYVIANTPYIDNIPMVSGLQATERTWTTSEGILNIGMDLRWDSLFYSKMAYYQVSLSRDGVEYTTYGNAYDNQFFINGLQQGIYYVSVQVVASDGIKGNPFIIVVELTGKDTVPPNVKILDTDTLPNGIRRFWWDYEYPEPNDVMGFKIKYIQGTNTDWDNAFDLHTGLVTEQPFETHALREGTHTVMIKAVDNAGSESLEPTSVVLNLKGLIEENVIWKEDLTTDKFANVTHNGIVGSDGILRANKADETLVLSIRFQPMSAGQLWLDHNITSKALIKYCVGSGSLGWGSSGSMFRWQKPTTIQWKFNNMYKPYTGRVMVNSTDSFHLIIEITPDSGKIAEVGKLTACIDVPDSLEKFSNLAIPADGLILPIKTPHYYTTNIRCDAIQGITTGRYQMEIMAENPCKIRFVRINQDASLSRTPVDVIADLTWQGFEREVI